MERLIRPKELQEILGISEATLYRRMKEPDFPDKVRISSLAIGFKETEIEDWIESVIEKPDAEKYLEE